jgi:PAS domain S-box-containing protein
MHETQKITMDTQSSLHITNTFSKASGLGFLAGLPIAIYLCDTEGRITYYNAAASALWGYEPEIGKDFWFGIRNMYAPDGSILLPESCPEAVVLREQRQVEGHEVVINRPNGTRINVMSHPQPLFDENGNMYGIINMLSDVTADKQREAELEKTVAKRTEKLRKSEERYHKMIDEVQDYAIILLDTKGNIMNWNRGAEKIKGYREEEIVGQNFKVFYRNEDVVSGVPDKLINEASATGKAMHEGWRVRKDGSMFWGYIVITALHDGQGNIIGYSKVTRDLTERKKSDDRMKAYAEDIALRNKQLEEFAYIASHDLQEPLRKIQTFADILRIKIDDKESVQINVDKITGAAQRMSILIKDVLKYSQLSATDNLFEEVDLNEVLGEVLGDFELQIQDKNVSIAIAPLPTIKGIPVQLHQLFCNLISNGIKFSDKETPQIEISTSYVSGHAIKDVHLSNPELNYVKIAVADNGIGFSPEYAEHVFKLFKRLNTFSSGTGIGLALCKKIAENHHGAINAESEPGQGATFNVYLPV